MGVQKSPVEVKETPIILEVNTTNHVVTLMEVTTTNMEVIITTIIMRSLEVIIMS